MDTDIKCSAFAFIHLKERCEQFLLDVIDTAPQSTATSAMNFLNRTRYSLKQCAAVAPPSGSQGDAEKRLLSLKHFQRHISSEYNMSSMSGDELNTIMARLSEDAVFLLTELWSGCDDPSCREKLHELLEIEKEQLVFLITRND